LPDDFAHRIGRLIEARGNVVDVLFDPASLPDFLTKTFNGAQFLTRNQPINPALVMQSSYIPNETVPQLVRAAISYSNAEKSGVHIIATENVNVIDVEISFGRAGDFEDPTSFNEVDDARRDRPKSAGLRIDFTALHQDGAGRAHLVLYEAKRFDDRRLWGNDPPVLRQMEKYDAFLRDKEKTS
jgi:hypothetical protein